MAGSIDSRLHMALNVRDIERSIAFYEALFETGPDKVREGYARFDLDRPPVVLTLNARDKVREGRRLDHVGIRITDEAELERHLSRLKEFGCWIREQRDIICCHARQAKFWAKDPDGLEWEFYILVDDAPETTAKAETAAEAAAKGCCEG